MWTGDFNSPNLSFQSARPLRVTSYPLDPGSRLTRKVKVILALRGPYAAPLHPFSQLHALSMTRPSVQTRR